MECYVCGRKPEYFINRNKNIISYYEKIKLQINDKIVEEKSKYLLDNEFNEVNADRIKNISNELLDIKIQSIIDNLDSFLKLNPAINLLIKYYKMENKNKKYVFLKDLQVNYLNEPDNTKIKGLISLNNLLNQIDIYIKDISSKNYYYPIQLTANELGYGFMPEVGAYNDKSEMIVIDEPSLCMICKELFNKSSTASFQVMEQARFNDLDDDD